MPRSTLGTIPDGTSDDAPDYPQRAITVPLWLTVVAIALRP